MSDPRAVLAQPARHSDPAPAPKSHHKCALPVCRRMIPIASLFCGRHWFMLSGKARGDIWLRRREGREDNLALASAGYLAARKLAIDEVIEAEKAAFHP